MRETVRCAICTRQSVGSDGDLSSCRVQSEICRAYIPSPRSRNFELVAKRFGDGCSGTAFDRPAPNSLLEVVRYSRVERVVIHRLGRPSRNPRYFVMLLEELRDRGAKRDIVAAPAWASRRRPLTSREQTEAVRRAVRSVVSMRRPGT